MKNLDTATLRKANDYAVYRIFPLYKYVWLLIAFGLLSTTLSAQFFIEDFDDNTGATINFTNGPCNDGSGDYFGIVCANGGSCPNTIGAAFDNFTGGDGDSWLGAQDTNAEAACGNSTSVSAVIDNISITGNSNIVLCFQVAENDEGSNEDWDADSKVAIAVDFDNANSFADVFVIEAEGGTNTRPRVDLDMDGTGEGTEITGAFTSYCVILSGTGNLLDIRISIDNLEAGDEDIALDNFQLFSDEASGTPPVTPINTTLAIAPTDADKAEGDAGTTSFTFTVTRSGDVSGATDVNYAVTGSGVDPADAADFGGTLPSGTVNFTANETSKEITVNVSGDTDVEADEGFTVTLSNPTGGATITTATANGNIQNDDVDTYELRIVKYNDLDEDGTNNEINTSGVQNTSGNALTGWEFVVYDSQGNEVGQNTTSVENAGANGDLGIRASFLGLISGETYTICETQQEGWINTEPSNGVDNATYGEPCETVTLTSSNVVFRYFGNYQETGSITIRKSVDNDFFADMTFDFMFDGSTPFTLSENGDDFVVMDLPAGDYEVTEVVPANWDLVSISCNNPNNNTGITDGLTIVLEPGENEVCTFNNNYTGETGNITIRKDVDDNNFAGMDFDFMFNGDTPFTLSENGSAFVLENIPVGNYPVTEVVPANWDLVSISCNNPNNNTGLTDGLTIVLDANEDADCTFNNEFCPAPTLVSESFDPNTGQLTLVFESSIAAGIENINFTVLNNLIVQSSDGFTSAGGNEYNWNTPNPPTTATFVLVPAAADPSLSFGYSVNVTNECGSVGTFDGPATGSLEVTKVVNWGDVTPDQNQTFEICITGPSYPNGNDQGACQEVDFDGGTLTWNDLLPGEYIVTETDPGADWEVQILNSPVDVMPGATATATVTNTLIPATLTIVKEVVVGDNTTEFDFGLFGPDVISNSNQQQFTLTNGNQRVFDPLRPGNYAIAEYFETGWRNIRAEDIVCVDGNGNDFSVNYDSDNNNMRAGVLFTLGGGDDVTCTFTNLQCPTVEAGENQTICLTKSATLTGASFGASATEATWSIISEPEPGAGTLSETGATNTPATVTFSATEPGTYVLQLTTDAPDGCDPATDTVTIEVLNVNCGEFPWRGNE